MHFSYLRKASLQLPFRLTAFEMPHFYIPSGSFLLTFLPPFCLTRAHVVAFVLPAIKMIFLVFFYSFFHHEKAKITRNGEKYVQIG